MARTFFWVCPGCHMGIHFSNHICTCGTTNPVYDDVLAPMHKQKYEAPDIMVDTFMPPRLPGYEQLCRPMSQCKPSNPEPKVSDNFPELRSRIEAVKSLQRYANESRSEVAEKISITPKSALPGYEETASILEEAGEHTNGDRQGDYGHPIYDFTVAMNILNALGFRRYVSPSSEDLRNLGPQDQPIIMQAVKLSREYHIHKRDNLVDGAGYWDCLDKVEDAISKGMACPWDGNLPEEDEYLHREDK